MNFLIIQSFLKPKKSIIFSPSAPVIEALRFKKTMVLEVISSFTIDDYSAELGEQCVEVTALVNLSEE